MKNLFTLVGMTTLVLPVLSMDFINTIFKKSETTIETVRCVIKPATMGDFSAIRDLYFTPEVGKFAFFTEFSSDVLKKLNNENSLKFRLWYYYMIICGSDKRYCIYNKMSGKFMGNIVLRKPNSTFISQEKLADKNYIECGISLLAQFQRKGVATELISKIPELLALNNLNVNGLLFCTNEKNDAVKEFAKKYNCSHFETKQFPNGINIFNIPEEKTPGTAITYLYKLKD